MVAILIKSDLRNKTHDEIKEIWITATDPDRSKTMKGYENKELYHELTQREQDYHNENFELHNSELKYQ